MYCVVILRFLFWFVVRYLPQVHVWKSGNTRRSLKETLMLLFSWFTLNLTFWNYKVPWFLIAYFNLSLATHIRDEKFFLSGNFWCSSEKVAILLLSWSTLYNVIFNVWNALNLACWFSFDTSCPNSMFKTYLFLNFVYSAKMASIFFFSWSTLHLVFSTCKVSSFLIPDFTLSLVTQTLHAKRLYSQSSRCSAKEATILISHPNKWPKSWLILICHCLQRFLA